MSMHISRVEVENFKRLKEVDIDDLGQVVVIGGRNAQGKSSLVDAIWNTLGGKQRAVTRPIRDGEDKAMATITIESEDGGGFVVTRTWKQGKASTLKVSPIDGKAAIAGGQTFIDQFLGAFAFDPLAFAEQDPKKQRQTLIDLVGVDTSAIDADYDQAYDARTEQNREVKRLEGALGTMDRPARDVPEGYVSTQALVEELKSVERVEVGVDTTKQRLTEIDESIARLQVEREQKIV
ncbi:MAG: AAA family ATPase, partial [Kineosporiaceae bacterium]|nr:AAA family ATPase [Aeromicrobium sp.]